MADGYWLIALSGFRRSDGGEGNRTPDLLNAIQALSQLSYAPGRDTLANVPPKGLASEGVRNRAV